MNAITNPDYFAHRYFGEYLSDRYFGGTPKQISITLVLRWDHNSPLKGDPHYMPVIGFITSRQIELLAGMPQGTM